MKILVCITHVPDTTARISFSEGGRSLNKEGVPYIIGPYDDYALARAIELREEVEVEEVVVLHVGTSAAEASLRKALAIGADRAVRIDVEATDALFVAHQVVSYVKEHSFDLIMMGREGIEYNSGLTHGMVGAYLGIEVVSAVMSLSFEEGDAKLVREIEGGTEELRASLPLVLGCQEPIAEWKIPNMRGIMTARTKPLEVRQAVVLERTAVLEASTYSLPPSRQKVQLLPPDDMDQLVELLRNKAGVI